MALGLHKIYFTMCMLSKDWKINKFADYPTREDKYESCGRKVNSLIENCYEVSATLKSTENTQYVINRIMKEGGNYADSKGL